MNKRNLLLPLAALVSTPAHAQLPEPVRAMIDAAIATGDPAKVETVIEVAKSANPGDIEEIDAVSAAWRAGQAELAAAQAATQERELRQAGLLDRWSGEGQIGAFQSSGNTDAIGGSAQLKLVREGIAWEHRLRLAADYRRNNGQTQREQFVAAYEPRYELGERAFAYALAQFERDRFQGYLARYSASGGIGYKLLDRPTLKLSAKAGPAWRHTEFVSGLSDSSLALLVGADFDWSLSEAIKLSQDLNAVSGGGASAQAFISSDNVSIDLVTGLEASISSDLSARLSYAIEYDSDPPPGAVSTDTLTRFTLVYGF